MKTIDFTQLGGFPLKQLTTKTMQDMYNSETLQALIAWLTQNIGSTNFSGIWNTNDAYILTGIETIDDGGTAVVTPGWLIRENELLYFGGSTLADISSGGGIGIQTTTTNATFKDGGVHPVYVEKIAVAGGSDALALNAYNRLPDLSEFAPVIRKTVTEDDIPTLNPGESTQLSINVPGAAVGDAVVVGCNPDSDTVAIKGFVDALNQVRINITNRHQLLPYSPESITFKIRVFK